MREIEVTMLIDIEDGSSESLSFTVKVNDDWQNTEEARLEIYESFRRDAVLDIDGIECVETGEDIEEGQGLPDLDEEEEQ